MRSARLKALRESRKAADCLKRVARANGWRRCHHFNDFIRHSRRADHWLKSFLSDTGRES